MSQPAGDSRPRSQQIAAGLRAKIMSGDLPAGAKIASTAELMAEHNAHNATVQNAIAILKSEGYLEGRTGIGVFVRATQQQTITPADYGEPTEPGERYPWTTVATRRGEVGASEIIEVGEVQAPAEVAQAFNIERDAPVVRRYQLLTLNGEPVELVSLYFPVELARGTALAQAQKISGGTPALLKRLGRTPVRHEDVISARPATSEEFVRLRLPTEVPVLRTFRVVLTAVGEAVQCEVLVKAGNRRNIRYRWPS